MAGSINKVTLVGNLGRDPEIRHTSAGKKIANFSLATSDVWRDATGNRQEKTEWHRIVVFNSNVADFVERFLKKGSKVYVEGALQTRKWADNNGQDRYVTEIVIGQFRGELVLMDPRPSDGGYETNVSAVASPDAGWDSTPVGDGEAFNDEIPF